MATKTKFAAPAAPTTPGLQSAPRAAFRFAAAPVEFGDFPEGTNVFPFTMTARSGDAIEHWYWGRIIHDMAGIVLDKPSVTVDYAHGFDDVIGFANQFTATNDGLQVAGALVSIEANDKADEIYKKSRAGVPYESSIDWEGSGTELEFVPDGVTTEVNGRQFAGPGYVVRAWPLRAIAVCRYGADSNTTTQFSQDAAEVGNVCQFHLKGSGTMTTKKATAADATDQTATEEPAGDAGSETNPKQLSGGQTAGQTAGQPNMISLDTVRQFSAEFGTKAPEYLSQGLTLDAARYQFAIHQRDTALAETKQLSEQLATVNTELATAKQHLKQFGANLGQSAPLGEQDGETKQVRQFSQNGDHRAAFAAAMKRRGET